MKFILGIKQSYKYFKEVMLKKLLTLKFMEEQIDPETGKKFIKFHWEAFETLMRMGFKLGAYLFSIVFYLLDDVLLMV